MMSGMEVVRGVEDLSAEWLSGVVGAQVADFATERVGTGQMSQNHRVRLEYADGEGPATVIVKVAAQDPTSRATGVGMGAYEREIRFYRELAPRIGGPLAALLAPPFHPAGGWVAGVLAGGAAG